MRTAGQYSDNIFFIPGNLFMGNFLVVLRHRRYLESAAKTGEQELAGVPFSQSHALAVALRGACLPRQAGHRIY